MRWWLCGLLCLCASQLAAAGWLDGARSDSLAREAVALLLDAPGHGLQVRDYDGESLATALAAGTSTAALSAHLDRSMRRYLEDLHLGRVDPRKLHHDFQPVRRAPFDAAATLQRAHDSGRLADAVDAAVPPIPLYGQLRQALTQYRALAGHPAWNTPLPPLPAPGRFTPGQLWAGEALLRQRLHVLGDLPDATAAEAGLDLAVREFQRRHGLSEDGVVGGQTRTALQVTPAWRARQIALSLERLRWTPLLQGPRMIVVNVPEYVLRAYEVKDGRIHVRLQMKVVVGKAADTRTPLFDEDMRFIEFSPYWNVPPSIARGELVPRLRRDPVYWAQQGFEFVGPGGQVDQALSAARLDAVKAGRWRIRQRPGPRNALGDIKFVFPNASNIFLHHTPALEVFGRARRDFSHGCIRVQDPVALAGFVLQTQPGWDEARIRAAMSAGRSTTLKLAEPLPVLIAYGTALVKQGRVFFLDDVYGVDRQLDAALQTPRNPP